MDVKLPVYQLVLKHVPVVVGLVVREHVNQVALVRVGTHVESLVEGNVQIRV